MTVLSLGQVAAFMQQAGVPATAIPQGLGVATAESGLRTDAVSPPNSNGTVDRGLWQINSVHGKDPARLMDPAYNTQVAFELWSSAGNSWRPWSTFNNGSAHVVNTAYAPALNPLGGLPQWLTGIVPGGPIPLDILGRAGGGIVNSTGLANLGKGVGVVVGTLTSVSFWKRAAILWLGWMTLVIGFVVLVSGSKPAKMVTKAVAKGAVLA